MRPLVSVSLTLLQDINSSQDKESGYKYVPQLSRIENHRGCPRLEIKQELLHYLLQLGFSCPKIVDVLSVSFVTVRRTMSEFGLSITSVYSNIIDCELDLLVSRINIEFLIMDIL